MNLSGAPDVAATGGGCDSASKRHLSATALPLTPVTQLFGPSVSLAIMLTVAPAETAISWYYVLSREVVGSRLAAFVGAAVCGFCPGLVSQNTGYPVTDLASFPTYARESLADHAGSAARLAENASTACGCGVHPPRPDRPAHGTLGGVNRPLLLVDSASLYFRAYYGIPESAVTAADGTPVNAVRGFLDMLATLVRTRRPGRVVCALDADWRPAWRVELLASYKTHRLAPEGPDGAEEAPDGLAHQIPIILDALDALGIPAIGAAGYEADDVIGTLAAHDAGPVEVATGDRDLFQVIDDARGVRVLYCGRGVAKLEVYDDAAVRARFGVPAAAYADFAALRGDPSDGLPGVAGVGEKTAARLITDHGSVSALLTALGEPGTALAPGLRSKLAAAREYLTVAPTVVRVATDVTLPPVDGALPRAPVDEERVLQLAGRWNLAGALRRLVDALAS